MRTPYLIEISRYYTQKEWANVVIYANSEAEARQKMSTMLAKDYDPPDWAGGDESETTPWSLDVVREATDINVACSHEVILD